jgi:ribokinase
MPPSAIIVLGSVNTDLVIRSPRIPAPGETVLGGEYFQASGGKGANQAVAAARAARDPVTFIAAVGDDEFGRAARDNFSRENLVSQYITTVPNQPSGVALIFVDEQGENAISVASGANLHLTPQHVDALPENLFAAAGVFLCCLESPVETVVRGLQRARAAGLVTILNPAPALPEIATPEILALVDVLTPNAGEAALLSGRDDVEEAAQQLRNLGCGCVITTLGPDGCQITGETNVRIPGRKVTAVDTTAAGDAFNGALAVAVSEGLALEQAAHWATAAAALAVTRSGAQPSLANRDAIEAALSKMGE